MFSLWSGTLVTMATSHTAVSLFILGLAIRVGTAIVQIEYGIQPYALPQLTLWNDFHGYYVPQLASLASGLLPYRDFPYSYPPLFLYGLYPFYALGGPVLASAPILVADAATGAIIYLSVRQWTTEKTATLAGITYCALPFALIYEGYLWLSSQPMTLLMILSVYYAKRRNSLSSAAALGVGSLFKQEALFILPAYYLFQVSHRGKGMWRQVVVLGGILFLGSLPFLVLIPGQYLISIGYGLGRIFGFAGAGPPFSPLSSGVSSCANLTLTLLGTHVGCTYFYVIYSNPILTYALTFLDNMSQWILIPLVILLGVALFATRRSTYFLEISSVYSIILFLIVFAYTTNLVLRYYLLPIYVFILSSSRSIKALSVGVMASTISLVTPEGAFQLVLATFATLTLLAQEPMPSVKA